MNVPARIDVEGGTCVVLTWEDETQTAVSARALRAGCPCAGCGSEAGASRAAAILGGPVEVKIKTARLVGAYAVNFEFAHDRTAPASSHLVYSASWDRPSRTPPDKCLNRYRAYDRRRCGLV
jgi:DUF971 family protein